MKPAPEMEPTIGGLIADLRRRFAAAGLATPEIDARTLVMELGNVDLTAVVADSGRKMSAETAGRIEVAAIRRLRGESVHRVLGCREFYGLMLAVSPATLEPRPDTEILVDVALGHVRHAVDRRGGCRVLDVGTGSGAIALALLAAETRIEAIGIDIAPDAVAVAGANAARLGLKERFVALCSDWFAAVEGRFDIIVANPPYVRSGDIADLPPEVRLHDPLGALDGGPDGLAAYRALAQAGRRHLQPDGVFAVEVGHDQAGDVVAVFGAHGWRRIEQASDLAGHQRVLVFA